MTSETGFDPALYDRFPTKEPRPEAEREELERIWCAPKGWRLLTVVNNNYVGTYYVGAAFLFFVFAGVLALVMRAQLALPLQGILPQETYNQFFTMHGTVMMFLFAVPMVEALGVLLLPQMLAARDLPFPRLSAYAFWAYFVGGLCFFASLFFGLAPDGGWFMYPPLTSRTYSPGINADFWLLGIGFIEISAIAGAIEILVGVLRTRAPGMTLDKMPIFAWAMLAFAVMIIIAFPAVILGTLLLELERALNWPFFDATRGGDPVLWQHLFWFFGHPEVYIIFLPAAGLVSMMAAALSRTPIVGYELIVLAIVATAFISFGVWSHHMFTTGMPLLSVSFFSAASMAVSVPAGIQVFAWIATFATGRPVMNTPTLFLLGGLVTFVIGGLTGVMVALVPFDWQAHDSYFIVAHLHYVLIGGMVFPMFAALYYWTPMMSRNALSERAGKWVFWLTFSGMQIAFLPMHLTGLMGMPRRVYTYLPGRDWEIPNMISTVGAFMIGAGVLLFVVDLARRFRFATDGNAGNIYGGGTLEWLPNGLYSARSIPVIRSREPLWDDPGLADDVDEGRYFLPGSATGHRETVVTSPIRAEPQYLQIMPEPSVWPLMAAVFTAGFFILLTIQAYVPSVVSGLLALAAMIRWLWETDRPVADSSADIGAGIRVPTYVTGSGSHGWWAMVILLIVIGMVFIMALFSYVYLLGIHPDVWRAPPAPAWLAPIIGANIGAAGLALLARRLLARDKVTRWTPATMILLAAAALVVGSGADWSSWRATGLAGPDSGQGATVHALMSLQSLLVAIAALMALYLAARTARGLVTKPSNSTLDLAVLFTVYTAAQGSVAALVTRLVPGG
ncbi:cbb3-type cytochrome c oxidase subunit I [Allosphingosinicella indica]|uniref:Cytochrome c oxidase subunit I+III n=1 Tax=Allosphingosinicella indica TaxID=941907 RepID=A0A1X7FYL5_9SPHN|nr:cbb3-type cytochrome c oxidase subunit I [Allosphingosinicella indica]SMF61210.1 cytochrome c oxidase subunit I+III [Allosphingosinicella indica]